MTNWLTPQNLTLIGLLASLAAGLSAGLGAIPVFFTKKIPDKISNAMLGFAAGVMLAATSFSLVVPAIEKSGGGINGAVTILLGIVLGGVFLDYIDKTLPHFHAVTGMEGKNKGLSRIWLFIIAITIHNFPEGLAVGAGFGGFDYANGFALAIGIGVHNMPEGLAVAMALKMQENTTPAKAFGVALLTGLVEPVGALFGLALTQLARPILPLTLAFAAGAMLFVISDEIIPETHRRGFQRIATYGVLIGFAIMTILDTIIR
ncbi:ZIP family zinc transporter [Caldicoprobacter guelmensis]|uniref:ZIP family metal transporter n=1 Tax=Caldicoprobacter guelmensis TaxID=1170224 RepID=UPI00195BB007|nr:ZIP family metal transporter [Caldicoprobacter guelmensis]MBM7583155.1 ZIP family zinc transporter [Caldicoprobacter guelmensis]